MTSRSSRPWGRLHRLHHQHLCGGIIPAFGLEGTSPNLQLIVTILLIDRSWEIRGCVGNFFCYLHQTPTPRALHDTVTSGDRNRAPLLSPPVGIGTWWSSPAPMGSGEPDLRSMSTNRRDLVRHGLVFPCFLLDVVYLSYFCNKCVRFCSENIFEMLHYFYLDLVVMDIFFKI
jgi:hypothetical protein